MFIEIKLFFLINFIFFFFVGSLIHPNGMAVNNW